MSFYSSSPQMGCCSSRHPSRIVNTKYGPVQGTRIVNDGELRVDAFLVRSDSRLLLIASKHQSPLFQGIPFAEPPVGQLRFKVRMSSSSSLRMIHYQKPLPPRHWLGIRQCTKFARRCSQKDYFLHDRIMVRMSGDL